MDDAAHMGTIATKALALLIEAVEQVPDDSWQRPSNLEGWTVSELVGHATGSTAKILTLVEGGEISRAPSEPADWVCEDRAARLSDLAARLHDALPNADLNAMRPSPQGDVPAHRALTFPIADLAIHSWDVHRSVGRMVELPDDVLAFCQGFVDSLPEEALRQPGAIGPAKPAPPDASATARLMAFLGRALEGRLPPTT